MKANFTPGPWEIDPDKCKAQWNVGVPGKTSVALTTAVEGDNHNLYPELNSIRDANTRLISASPDLLEAAKTLVRRIERDNLHTTHGVQLEGLRTAISKAEKGD